MGTEPGIGHLFNVRRIALATMSYPQTLVVGIAVSLLLIALMALTVVVGVKKGLPASILFAMVVWVLPAFQVYFDSGVRLVANLLGADIGLRYFAWGRGVIFALQLAMGVAAGLVIMKRTPNKSPEATPGERPSAAPSPSSGVPHL